MYFVCVMHFSAQRESSDTDGQECMRGRSTSFHMLRQTTSYDLEDRGKTLNEMGWRSALL